MNIVEILCTDVIVYMMDYLSDIDKINFLKTCSSFYNHRFCVKFNDFHSFDKIRDLDYSENFKRIVFTKTKNNVKSFTLNNSYDRIPIDAKHLVIGKLFKLSLKNIIPRGITHLTIEEEYGSEINPGEIPDTVTYLNIKSRNILVKKGAIPDSVTHLYFGSDYLSKDIIPKNVVYLRFGDFSECEIGQRLVETRQVNGITVTTTRIESYIPESVACLHLEFSMSDNSLGEQIIETQEINGEKISTTKIVSYIPKNVTCLTIFNDVYKNTFNFIPKNVTKLNLFGEIIEMIDETIIPKNITTLGLACYRDLNKIKIPKKVTCLKFLFEYFTIPKIFIIPEHITTISLKYTHDIFKNVVFNNIPNLKIDSYYFEEKSYLPNSIKTLTIYGNYDKNIIKKLPNTINTVIFKHK
ncbi:FNIP repeat-containing protein [Acanthamoeba polyphaga mimivirus]|nr:FNIP repeat-containing protein [Mimivirus reunion]WMV61770.1 FNIP repeat-containing protein [Mimivirus sp.]WMV62747.1 FNIP repeat-containing protein [Acanthamoeba polyphaga mimivirus]WMV63724.1 FNIP repeat-containing protein [Mimivirus sp.]